MPVTLRKTTAHSFDLSRPMSTELLQPNKIEVVQIPPESGADPSFFRALFDTISQAITKHNWCVLFSLRRFVPFFFLLMLPATQTWSQKSLAMCCEFSCNRSAPPCGARHQRVRSNCSSCTRSGVSFGPRLPCVTSLCLLTCLMRNTCAGCST